ncbi:hypothetical protein F4808DRAFT_435937 [Astrocystis sublimbata]|nr:hypothetical protein F4808DRAFT_435937 [Astrocystis sublimbata]
MNLPFDTYSDEDELLTTHIDLTPPRVTVKIPKMQTFGRSAIMTDLTDVDTSHIKFENHRWLQTMDNFCADMKAVWDEAQAQAKSDSNKKQFADPVTIALIDDGVDVLEPSLQGKLIDGKTLSYDLAHGSEPT